MAYEKLRYDRILSSHRQGNGAKIQMFGGQTGSPLSDPAADDIAIYDANGNVVSSGQSIADISPRVRIAKAGTLIGTRSRLNLIEGSNVTMTVADDAGNDEIDCTIAAAGGSGGGSVTVGAIADLPASPDTNGEVYRCTDAPYVFYGYGSPLGWKAFYGPWPVYRPPSTGWTSDNFHASSTIDSTYGYEFLTLATQANLQIRYRTAPTAPYTVKALLQLQGISGDRGMGLFFRDGSGKIIRFSRGYTGSWEIIVQKWNSSSSFSGNYNSSASNATLNFMAPSLIWMWMDDGATSSGNLTWKLSLDGFHWHQFDQRSRTDFMASGPTQIGFGGNADGGQNGISLLSWQES